MMTPFRPAMTLALPLALLLPLCSVRAQGTAFLYQGRLNCGANPASGFYDVRFTLYDAATNGGEIGEMLTNAATPVVNGLFSASLDFGAGVFTGPDLWLQLDVRTNGAGLFTPLSPRQPILPAPYAIMANTANNLAGPLAAALLTNGAGAVNLAGTFTGNGSGLSGITAAQVGAISTNQLPALGSALTNLPVVWLFTNNTAWVNGQWTNWPNSRSAGWNEVQALFPWTTNNAGGTVASGFKLVLAAGEYDFQVPLWITNNEMAEGAGGPSTILRYTGATDSWSMADVTAALDNQVSYCGLLNVSGEYLVLAGSGGCQMPNV